MTDDSQQQPDKLEKSLGDQATGADVEQERSLGDQATTGEALSSLSDLSGLPGDLGDEIEMRHQRPALPETRASSAESNPARSYL